MVPGSASESDPAGRVGSLEGDGTLALAIRAHDEALWRHLENSIYTGAFCSSRPEQEIAWRL